MMLAVAPAVALLTAGADVNLVPGPGGNCRWCAGGAVALPRAARASRTCRLDVEVLRLRVVGDERVGRLFRNQHVVLTERHADLLGPQQLDDLGTLLEVGAGGVPEA